MTISREDEIEIRRLFYAEHWRVGTIAAQRHHHEDAVNRVLGLDRPRKPQPPSRTPVATSMAPIFTLLCIADLMFLSCSPGSCSPGISHSAHSG